MLWVWVCVFWGVLLPLAFVWVASISGSKVSVPANGAAPDNKLARDPFKWNKTRYNVMKSDAYL